MLMKILRCAMVWEIANRRAEELNLRHKKLEAALANLQFIAPATKEHPWRVKRPTLGGLLALYAGDNCFLFVMGHDGDLANAIDGFIAGVSIMREREDYLHARLRPIREKAAQRRRDGTFGPQAASQAAKKMEHEVDNWRTLWHLAVPSMTPPWSAAREMNLAQGQANKGSK